MYKDRQLSTEAVNLSSEYVHIFPRKGNSNLEPEPRTQNLEPDNAHDAGSDDDADSDEKW